MKFYKEAIRNFFRILKKLVNILLLRHLVVVEGNRFLIHVFILLFSLIETSRFFLFTQLDRVDDKAYHFLSAVINSKNDVSKWSRFVLEIFETAQRKLHATARLVIRRLWRRSVAHKNIFSQKSWTPRFFNVTARPEDFNFWRILRINCRISFQE